jgi:hypothetical protein
MVREQNSITYKNVKGFIMPTVKIDFSSPNVHSDFHNKKETYLSKIIF